VIQLGATVLNPNLTWPDRDNFSSVVQTRARTLGGSQVFWAQEVSAGRPISLVAINDQGWFTKEQKDAVVAMAQVAGAVYTLIIGAESFSVMFDHEQGNAIEFQPLITRAVDLTGDYFWGQIKLITV